MGVGACAWEGEMLLAAYLLSEWQRVAGCCPVSNSPAAPTQCHPPAATHTHTSAAPAHHYTGLSVVELGSGPGLAGLLAAKLGARVAITDKAVVVPLIAENIALNGISDQPTASCSGSAEVCGGGGLLAGQQQAGCVSSESVLACAHCTA
jgi:hypothetical protein